MGRKLLYGEELKRQMLEKDKRMADEARSQAEWDAYHERRIARDYSGENQGSPNKFSKNQPIDPNGPPPNYDLYKSPYYPPPEPPAPPLPWQKDDDEDDTKSHRSRRKVEFKQEDEEAELSAPAKVNAMVKQHMESVKEKLGTHNEQLQKEMARVREEVNRTDQERSVAMHELRDLKVSKK